MNPTRIAPAVTVLLLGLSVFLVQMTFASQLPQGPGLIVRAGLCALLLSIAIFGFRQHRDKPYGMIFYLYFVASTAILASSFFGNWGLGILGMTTDNPAGIAVAKFVESLPIVVLIIVLARIVNIKPGDLYLRIGRLGKGLTIGALFFAGFTLLTLFTGDLIPLFNEKLQNDSYAELFQLIPWILVFVFSNAIMEEILFRGLFLKYFESILGFGLANGLTALLFSLAHLQVTYVTSMLAFLVVVFFLGMLLGDTMQKTRSIIGPVLIHAGADVMLILPMFSGFI